MSNGTQLRCLECNEYISVGGTEALYTKDLRLIDKMSVFLFEHKNHRIVFESDANWSNGKKYPRAEQNFTRIGKQEILENIKGPLVNRAISFIDDVNARFFNTQYVGLKHLIKTRNIKEETIVDLFKETLFKYLDKKI